MKLHIVPARTGLAWVKLGIRAFWRQPMALAALFFMTMAAMSLATMIPLVGPAVALALLPSATLAMMVAAAEAVQGRFPTPAVLLVAFRTVSLSVGAFVPIPTFPSMIAPFVGAAVVPE